MQWVRKSSRLARRGAAELSRAYDVMFVVLESVFFFLNCVGTLSLGWWIDRSFFMAIGSGGNAIETLNDHTYPLTSGLKWTRFTLPGWLLSYPAKSRGQIRTTYSVSRVSRLLAMSQIFVIVVSSYVMTSLAEDFILFYNLENAK